MVNSLRAIRTLVRSGAGINSGPLWLYQEDMNTGKLVEVLPHQPVSGFSVYAVYTNRTYQPYKTRQFIQRLSERIAASCQT